MNGRRWLEIGSGRGFRGVDNLFGRQSKPNSLLISLLQGINRGDGFALDCIHRHTVTSSGAVSLERSRNVGYTLTVPPAVPKLGLLLRREPRPCVPLHTHTSSSGKIRRCCVDRLSSPPKADIHRPPAREVGVFSQVLRIHSHGFSAAGATVAGYSGRISKCSWRWAMRSAISASAGLAARAKMNPR